jgi:PadR family transcriptional regulator PadR
MPGTTGDAPRGHTRTIVLSLLAEQPMYGFQIAREVQRRSHGALDFKEGLLYPILRQLEKDGLAETEWRPAERGTERRYYFLTPKGKREARRRRRQWATFAEAVNQVIEGGTDG